MLPLSIIDLKNQIALAYEGQTNVVVNKLNISSSISTVLSNAQKIFNEWSNLPPESQTAKSLFKQLNQNYDFFKLLDSVTMARSRKHIEKYYDMSMIGKFPSRNKPKSIQTELTKLTGFMSINTIYEKLSDFDMSVYNPFAYIFPSRMNHYAELYDTEVNSKGILKQSNREESLKKLMRVNFLKRLESSVDSFRITLNNFCDNVESVIKKINDFELNGEGDINEVDKVNFEDEEWLDEEYSIGTKVKINLNHMDVKSWKVDLKKDLLNAQKILEEMNKVTPEEDEKLNRLKEEIQNKINHPINDDNKKIIIFTAFADTANYLYKQLHQFNSLLGLHSGKIVGNDANQTTLKIDKKFNTILSHFSPQSKNLKLDNPNEQIDILVATDCISEGQNLQDCDHLINYDIHWNPVRIIQRFGRIDRIGSKNKKIQLVNFWPNISLDEYINLKNRVEKKMHMVDVTATGEDNILTNESSDMQFRKKQLQKLQNEVVDIEDMDNSISITDLGLNDFRMDLLKYIEEKGDISNVSSGMHTVCPKDISKGIDEGVIFVLKNVNHTVNIEGSNQLHPFYLVHINKDGEIKSNYLNVKSILDRIRYLCKGKNNPLPESYRPFNEETKDGKNMDVYSDLLGQAISSIITTKDESDIESLFTKGGTGVLENKIKGLDDFELIAFLVIQ